jgi:hypothetical protein
MQHGCLNTPQKSTAASSFPARGSSIKKKARRRASSETTAGVQVYARFRPQNAKEAAKEGQQSSSFQLTKSTVVMKDSKKDSLKQYDFSRVFSSEQSQQNVYEESVRDMVLTTTHGHNACAIAYGQTSSGKTYTMEGTDETPGIIPRAVADIFAQVRIWARVCLCCLFSSF